MRFLFIILLLLQPIDLAKTKIIKKEDHFCTFNPPNSAKGFDFKNLTTKTVKYNETSFINFKLCEYLEEKCNNSKGFYACLHKNGEEIGIGYENPIVDNTNVIFKYKGQQCGQRTYAINVKMICDYDINNQNRIKFDDVDECFFNISWQTQTACLQKKEIDCIANDRIHYYNLNSLKSLSSNYEIYTNNNFLIIFNICHTILYKANMCNWKSTACLIDKNNDKSYSIGSLMYSKLSNNSSNNLQLIYEVEGFGPNNCDTKMKTIITFICDPNAVENVLEYTGGIESCSCHITFKSANACYKNKIVEKRKDEMCGKDNNLCKKEEVTLQRNIKCTTVQNEFDFEELKSRNYFIRTNDSKYYINICKSLEKDLNCSEGVGICKVLYTNSQQTEEINLGYPDAGPILTSDKSAVLIYHNGSICKDDTKKRIESSISFLCGGSSQNPLGHPEYVEYKDCTYFFKWETSIMCTKINTSLSTKIITSKNHSLSILGDFQTSPGIVEHISPINKMHHNNDTNQKLKPFINEPKTFNVSGNTITIIIVLIIILVILTVLCYLKISSRQFCFLDMICNKTPKHYDRVRYSRVCLKEC